MISRSFLHFTFLALALAAGAFTAAGQTNTGSARVAELRVDDLKTPLGIDDPSPRFSWQLSRSRTWSQTGCLPG